MVNLTDYSILDLFIEEKVMWKRGFLGVGLITFVTCFLSVFYFNRTVFPPFILEHDRPVEFEINKLAKYVVLTSFKYKAGDELDRAAVKKGIEGADAASLILNVKIQHISREGGGGIFEKKVDMKHVNISSWGADVFNKEIYSIELRPGLYRVIVEKTQFSNSGPQFFINFAEAYRGK